MRDCNAEIEKDASVKMAEKPIETKPKGKVKNNTSENIKHLVLGQPKKVEDGATQTPMENTISIG